MGVARDLNRAVERAQKQAGRTHEPDLRRAYEAQLRNVLKHAVKRYRQIAGLGLRAAADWSPPTTADILAINVQTSRIRRVQRRMLAQIAGTVSSVRGVDFDLIHPVSQELLDKMGVRAGRLSDALREPVAHAVARGWASGMSVPDTADLIRQSVGQQIGAKAEMLARTDLIGLSNGGGQLAAGELNAAAAGAGQQPPIQTKVWLSSQDGRVRPSHVEADGQQVPFDAAFTVGGASLQYPGDPGGPDEEVINCRCTTLYEEAPPPPAPSTDGSSGNLDELSEPPPKKQPLKGFGASFDLSDFRSPMFGANRFVKPRLEAALERFDKAIAPEALEGFHDRLSIVDPAKVALPLKGTVDDPANAGAYHFLGRTPVKMEVDLASDHPETTLMHEIGHLVDHQLLGNPGEWTLDRRATDASFAFLAAASRTAAIQEIKEQLESGYVKYRDRSGNVRAAPMQEDTTKFGRYLLDPAEIWARAFAQWAARHDVIGSLRAMDEMDKQITHTRHGRGIALFRRQWDWDEFDALGRAVEAVLEESGVLAKTKQLTAAALRRFRHRDPVAPRLLAAIESSKVGAGPVDAEALRLGQEPHDLVFAGAVGAEHVDHQGGHADHDSDAGRQGPAERGEYDSRKRSEEAGMPETAETTALRWRSDFVFEGISTGDGRWIAAGALTWREPPLTLMAQTETPDFGGHAGAEVAGRMDTFDRRERTMDGERLPDGARAIYAEGAFDSGDFGSETARMVDEGSLRGISADLSIQEWAFRDPETGDLIDPEDMSDEQWERAWMGEYEIAVLEGVVLAATIVPTPAFEHARIALLASAISPTRQGVWRANDIAAERYGVEPRQMMMTIAAPVERIPERALTASVSAPIRPPREWLFQPEADAPTPLTFMDDGRVFGHLATWSSCHTGFISGTFGRCVTPPASQTNYAHFHVGEIVTAEGDAVPVGKLMVGESHAPDRGSRTTVRSFYDRTGAVGAYVRAVDGKHGIWVSGVVRDGLTDEQMRDLRANPPSGDWREVDRNLELIAAIAVPVPGFPIPRTHVTLAASADGDDGRITTLILSERIDPTSVLASGEAVALAAEIDGGPAALHDLIMA